MCVEQFPPRSNVTNQLVQKELQPHTRLPPTRRVEFGILSGRYTHSHADGENTHEDEPGAARVVIRGYDENIPPAALDDELPERLRLFPGIGGTTRKKHHGP